MKKKKGAGVPCFSKASLPIYVVNVIIFNSYAQLCLTPWPVPRRGRAAGANVKAGLPLSNTYDQVHSGAHIWTESTLVFDWTNWDIEVPVVVRGEWDRKPDGDIEYTVDFTLVASEDPLYSRKHYKDPGYSFPMVNVDSWEGTMNLTYWDRTLGKKITRSGYCDPGRTKIVGEGDYLFKTADYLKDDYRSQDEGMWSSETSFSWLSGASDADFHGKLPNGQVFDSAYQSEWASNAGQFSVDRPTYDMFNLTADKFQNRTESDSVIILCDGNNQLKQVVSNNLYFCKFQQNLCQPLLNCLLFYAILNINLYQNTLRISFIFFFFICINFVPCTTTFTIVV